MAYCALSQLLTLGANGYTVKFSFFYIRAYYEKLDHMLKPLLPNFRPDLWARLKDTPKKQVPAKLKPMVGINVSFVFTRSTSQVAAGLNVQ